MLMLLFVLLGCSGEQSKVKNPSLDNAGPADDLTPPHTPIPPAFLQMPTPPHVERFTLETFQQLTANGVKPPPCVYLKGQNQYGWYDTARSASNGVAYDALTVPVLETVSVKVEEGKPQELVKVLVSDPDLGEVWVTVLWFPKEAFSTSPDQASTPDVPPQVPGSCAVQK